MFICSFCGKEFNKKSSLVIHEKSCKLNPNAEKNPNRKGNGGIPCVFAGKTKETDETLKRISEKLKNKYKTGELKPVMKGKHHTEETKKLLSHKMKKWLSEHKDQHVWKRNNKFISKPCENFKNFLTLKNISFVPEYSPFDDVNYSIDIAFPDKKIGIEINGNQHYNDDGTLTEYYQKRHDLFISRGWNLFEIHYSKCYDISINDFTDILSLDIYDTKYVAEYFKRKSKLPKVKRSLQKIYTDEDGNKVTFTELKKQKGIKWRNAIILCCETSGIDFKKHGWSEKAKRWIKENTEISFENVLGAFMRYYPEFLEIYRPFLRKNVRHFKLPTMKEE